MGHSARYPIPPSGNVQLPTTTTAASTTTAEQLRQQLSSESILPTAIPDSHVAATNAEVSRRSVLSSTTTTTTTTAATTELRQLQTAELERLPDGHLRYQRSVHRILRSWHFPVLRQRS